MVGTADDLLATCTELAVELCLGTVLTGFTVAVPGCTFGLAG